MEEKLNLSTEELAEIVNKTVEEKIENKFESYKKTMNYMQSQEPEETVISKHMKRALKQLKALGAGEITKMGFYRQIEKTLNVESTDNLGGYLVPEEYNRYIPDPNDYGLARKYATIVPMIHDKMNFPYPATDIVAYNVAEGNQITAANYVFGNLQLDAKKFAALVPMSNELIADSYYDISPIFYQSMTRQFSGAEDQELVKAITGSIIVSESIATGSLSNWATVSASNFVNSLANIPGKLAAENVNYISNAVWVMNPTTLSIIRQLKDSQNRPLIDIQQGRPELYGYPIEISNKWPTATSTTAGTYPITFGNIGNALFGDRMSVDVLLAREGTVGSDNLLEKDLSAYRAITRFDIKVPSDRFSGLDIKA